MSEHTIQSPPTGDDPLQRSRRSTRRIAAVGVSALLLGGFWALMVPSPAPVHVPDLSQTAQSQEPPPSPLELAAFQAPVWTVILPPVKEAASPPPPPPPPLKVQLLAIMKESDHYKAVLYDPDTNKVRIVEAGEEVQGKTVERIAFDTVSIRNQGILQTLVLKAPGGAP